MKVEGMQYPLSVKPIGAKNGNNNKDRDLSDDAVYFEPEERREQKQQQHSPPKEEAAQLPLEMQVVKEVEPVKDNAPQRADENKTGERPPLNIIV